eukprot:CAMPEP_0181171986 /NCGR_PEP_ID=MMETSP1096-20121128/2210_1 /TAXON_ID=156174 ORGANISM="Chrysochromulina ericina, Strain CCMP281" /NCGR_SAMPLE_ID=MMETSP1096 /ASSEMBLY_ACC=CAM_ASM_000453 /LENGTH=62 /DNA_ID=CAMNT_0023259687 /DNA_START=173 /DNA_END=357 /DNA_ORIENTATION=+
MQSGRSCTASGGPQLRGSKSASSTSEMQSVSIPLATSSLASGSQSSGSGKRTHGLRGSSGIG